LRCTPPPQAAPWASSRDLAWVHFARLGCATPLPGMLALAAGAVTAFAALSVAAAGAGRPAVLAALARTLVAGSSHPPDVHCPLRAQCSDVSAADVEVQKRSASIAMRDGASIDARIYEPPAPVSAIVYAHGGAFSMGDCESNSLMARTLSANTRSVLVDTSYRQGKAHPHPAATHDLEDVTRKVRELYPGLPVGVAGSSSGGFFALELAQHPPDRLPYAFCLALNPVAHPGKRRDYLRCCMNGTAKEAGYVVHHGPATAAALLKMQGDYWVTDAAADDAGEALNVGPHFTPTLAVLGGQDLNVPPQVTAGLTYWVDRIITLGKYGHELCDRAPPNKDSYLPALSLFVSDALRRSRGERPEATLLEA